MTAFNAQSRLGLWLITKSNSCTHKQKGETWDSRLRKQQTTKCKQKECLKMSWEKKDSLFVSFIKAVNCKNMTSFWRIWTAFNVETGKVWISVYNIFYNCFFYFTMITCKLMVFIALICIEIVWIHWIL